MVTPRTYSDLEVTLSLRRHHGQAECLFVTVVEIESTGQRAVRHSRHITGDAHRLVDHAIDEAREALLEHWLAYCDPF